MNNKIIVPVLTAAMVGAAVFGVSNVSAQVSEAGGLSIIERIATRFNLDQEEVRAVFEEERAERQAGMQQRTEDRLTAAVTAGELTEEQKQLILEKHADLKAEMEAQMETIRESFDDMTAEERQATMVAKRDEMESRRAELEAWAEENGIDMKYLMMAGKFHGGPGHFKMRFSKDGAEKMMITETVAE